MQKINILTRTLNIIEQDGTISHQSFDFLANIINKPIKEVREGRSFYEFCVVDSDGSNRYVCFSSTILNSEYRNMLRIQEARLEEVDKWLDTDKIQIVNYDFFDGTATIEDVAIRYNHDEKCDRGYISLTIGNSPKISEFIIHWCYHGFKDSTDLCAAYNEEGVLKYEYDELVEYYPYSISLLDRAAYADYYYDIPIKNKTLGHL